MCCHAAFLIITNKTYDVYKFKHLMLSHSKLESTSMDAVWAYLAFILDLQDNLNCNTWLKYYYHNETHKKSYMAIILSFYFPVIR